MYQVFRIDVYDADGNSHGLGIRQENWITRKDQSFERLEDAKAYIEMKNRAHSILPNLLISLSKEEKATFVKLFCFQDNNNPWLSDRRFFLGEIPKDLIMKQLQAKGIKVVRDF